MWPETKHRTSLSLDSPGTNAIDLVSMIHNALPSVPALIFLADPIDITRYPRMVVLLIE